MDEKKFLSSTMDMLKKYTRLRDDEQWDYGHTKKYYQYKNIVNHYEDLIQQGKLIEPNF